MKAAQIAPATARNKQTNWAKHSDPIREAVAENPDRTLEELLDHLKIGVSRSTLFRAFKALKRTIKKVLNAAEQERPDVLEKRRKWIAGQAKLDPEKQVFIDETWLKTNMPRPRGRALKIKRLDESVPFGLWKTTTFVAALRTTGLIAPMVVEGPMNRHSVETYFEQNLIPKMRKSQEALESIGCQLVFLPPYSPDLNAIEIAFSKFWNVIKKAKERTVEGLRKLCRKILDFFDLRT